MALLLAFTTYFTLDTFVITRVYGDADSVQNDAAQTQDDSPQSSDSQSSEEHSKGHGPGGHGGPGGKGGGRSKDSSSGSSTDSGESSSSDVTYGTGTQSDSYSDSNINVTLKEYRQNDTTVYVADVTVSSPEYLKTALAQNAYGKNVTAKTSEIAESVNAVLAINGDYYGAQEKGYVIRNGKLYRSTAASGSEDLVIYSDGSFGIINESEVTAEQLIADGAVQTLSFGPALVQNGQVTVGENEEVGKAMASNPRTAIGIIDECHYLFVVSDGRTSESTGLSVYQLAQFMKSLGAETAYNLDGGGSSTMYFNGNVVNNPTSGGSIKERSVSDIVYIG